MEYHNFSAMNTTLLMAAEGQPDRVAEGFRKTESLIQRYERQFTRFSPDSELSALNRSAGKWFLASPDFFSVIRQALEYYHGTDGLFNPGILPALEGIGYDRSLEKVLAEGDLAPAKTPIHPFQASLFGDVLLDEGNFSINLPEGLTVDLGGVAKGWIAERAAHYLALFSQSCAVNAGGDLFVMGEPKDSPGWLVALDDPAHPGQDLAVLSIPQGGVATSSITKRTWTQGGVLRHHLIDPRTGQPAITEWSSVTVIAAHTVEAEILAKSLLIAGPQGAQRLMERYPEAAFITVDQAGKISGSENARKFYYENVE